MSKEVEPSFPFQRPPPQENTRCMLKDIESKLTLCGSNGRVNLVIYEEMLALILNQLHKDKKWSHERGLMEKEIHALRAQLVDAHAKVHSSGEIEDMKSQLTVLRESLWRNDHDLKQQTSISKDLQVKLDKMKAEKEDLRSQLWTTQADLEQQTSESKAKQLEQVLVFEKAQAQKLQKKLRMMEGAFLKQQEEAKMALKRSQASHQAQLEQCESETRKMASALKKAKSLLVTERLRLQQ